MLAKSALVLADGQPGLLMSHWKPLLPACEHQRLGCLAVLETNLL